MPRSNPVKVSVVCPHCSKRHPITIHVHDAATRKAGLKWDSVDWSQTTKQIAAEMGVEPSLVSAWRGKLSPDTKRSMMPPLKKSRPAPWWADVDWSKTDAEIAIAKGKARTTVIYHRSKKV